MNKKLCYAIEKKGSLMPIVYYLIGFLIFLILLSILLGNFSWDFLVYMIGLAIFIFLCTYIFFLVMEMLIYNKVRRELNNIKEMGVRVDGTLIKFRHVSADGDGRSYYTLTVQYINPYTNEVLQYETPALSFDAHHELGSKKCNVYILDDKVYVTDFVGVEKGEENVWAREDDYYKNVALREKKLNKIAIVLIILVTLLFIGIILLQLGWRP